MTQRILDTAFGAGLKFQEALRAWKDDPQRPALLHYAAIAPGAQALPPEWQVVNRGFHRLVFEGGRVLLTLCVGETKSMLREQDFAADQVLLDGHEEDDILKAVTRCCRRGTRVASDDGSEAFRRRLLQAGFAVEPQGQGLHGRFDPAWTPRGLREASRVQAAHCVVIGGGLAGAAAAASLARRGWQVRVLDTAPQPAAGASALPAGLLAPHISHDDNLLSRLSRAGVRLTLQQAGALLGDEHWQPSGVLERREGAELWHAHAGWIKPGALVRAWLAQPGIQWQGSTRVAGVEPVADEWRLTGDGGAELARAPLVVVAAAFGSGPLLGGAVPLYPVRGQVSWGLRAPAGGWPAVPMNGNGHFIPAVPHGGGIAWLTGSTYGRGDTGLDPRPADHQANLHRLRLLAPEVASRLEPDFAADAVQAWTGVRCASADRRPLLGQLQPGLWVTTAMGSRGLTFAALCGELLAARVHGEPLPLERKQVAALDPSRAKNFSLDRNN